MLRRFFIPVVLVLILIAGAVYFLTTKPHAPKDLRDAVPVVHFNLRNGMQVIVMPSDRIPAVTHMLYIKTGGADDPYGKSGLAHYMEHLMFSGTQDYPDGAYERAVQRVGGNQNAHTTRDYTMYYATVPKEHLAEVMAMEVDRLQHVDFKSAAPRELKVITEERHMRVENDPDSLLSEQLNALTFLNHPYHQPVIGWAEDMATFTAADAAEFFAQHYTPANMVLLVAGDVDARTVRRLAQQYYGNLPAAQSAPRNWPHEPPLRLMRHASMTHPDVQTPRLVRHYVAPSLKDGDANSVMPLWLMAQYLGGSETSVLYQQLVVQQKLASAVDISYDPFYRGPALLSIEATPAPNVTLEKLEAALEAEIATATSALPAEADVVRAKTQLKAEITFTQDGLTPLAELIGHLAMLDLDENFFYGFTQAVDAVTAQQMHDAVQPVLAPAHRVTGYLLPEKPSAAAVSARVAPPASTLKGGDDVR